MIDSSLHIDLSDGRKAKFLWLRIDEGYDVLEQAMTRSLNGHCEARD